MALSMGEVSVFIFVNTRDQLHKPASDQNSLERAPQGARGTCFSNLWEKCTPGFSRGALDRCTPCV